MNLIDCKTYIELKINEKIDHQLYDKTKEWILCYIKMKKFVFSYDPIIFYKENRNRINKLCNDLQKDINRFEFDIRKHEKDNTDCTKTILSWIKAFGVTDEREYDFYFSELFDPLNSIDYNYFEKRRTDINNLKKNLFRFRNGIGKLTLIHIFQNNDKQ